MDSRKTAHIAHPKYKFRYSLNTNVDSFGRSKHVLIISAILHYLKTVKEELSSL
jgi:hypothetical protein